jgi:signal transduction histidine kinase
VVAKYWKNFSISLKLYFVVGIMALLIVMELLTLKFAMNKLSAVRAFVGGEGSWSKAQKNSVHQLHQYITTGNEVFYTGFKEALKVPDGDRNGRKELEKANPDMEVVRVNFLQGEIHPDDLDAVIVLLRDFGQISYIKEAVRSWTKGDDLLIELGKQADKYHTLKNANQLTDDSKYKIAANVNRLNYEISLAEANFSSVLGEGSRWLESIVFMILFAIVITVECVGLTLTFFTSRSISNGLKDLIEVARVISKGNFSKKLAVRSTDEIGQLTMAINEMGSVLSQNYKELVESHDELERKVERRTAELNSALNSRDEFLSIASHEFRTPLTALTMQLEMIERYMRKNDVQDEGLARQVSRAVSHVRKMSALQNVLMDVTAMRVGKLELKKEKIDLTDVIADSINQFNVDTDKSSVKIIYQNSGPMVGEFDPTRMGQVFSNLLSNAIKYGAGKPIEVTSKVQDHQFIISVKDSGPGISPEKHAKIFERFERLHTGNDVPGLGLGLYIAKQLIETHGGELQLDSQPGEGTTFTVILKQS